MLAIDYLEWMLMVCDLHGNFECVICELVFGLKAHKVLLLDGHHRRLFSTQETV